MITILGAGLRGCAPRPCWPNAVLSVQVVDSGPEGSGASWLAGGCWPPLSRAKLPRLRWRGWGSWPPTGGPHGCPASCGAARWWWPRPATGRNWSVSQPAPAATRASVRTGSQNLNPPWRAALPPRFITRPRRIWTRARPYGRWRMACASAGWTSGMTRFLRPVRRISTAGASLRVTLCRACGRCGAKCCC